MRFTTLKAELSTAANDEQKQKLRDELKSLPDFKGRSAPYMSDLFATIFAERFFKGGERCDANIFKEFFTEGASLELIAFTAAIVSRLFFPQLHLMSAM